MSMNGWVNIGSAHDAGCGLGGAAGGVAARAPIAPNASMQQLSAIRLVIFIGHPRFKRRDAGRENSPDRRHRVFPTIWQNKLFNGHVANTPWLATRRSHAA